MRSSRLAIGLVGLGSLGCASQRFTYQDGMSQDAAPQAGANQAGMETESSSRLSDEVIPLQYDDVPDRPQPLLEIGNPFFSPGDLSSGFVLPTGAVWQPSLLVFGTLRTGYAYVDRDEELSDWANRLDVFFDLSLTRTERLFLALRPLDEENDFTGYNFDPDDDYNKEFNTRIESLFFEGDFGELFPNLDKEDESLTDVGISVGRQPVLYGAGQLIDDTMDSIMLTRNSLHFPGIPSLRVTALVAADDIHRGNNKEDGDAVMVGLFTEADLTTSTIELDLVGTDTDSDDGDALYAGIGATQRIGHTSSTIRVNTSIPDEDSEFVDGGTLVFAELNWTPKKTHDHVYFNGFVGIDNYTSAARRPTAGGPLGATGILFSATGLGQVPSPLSNRPNRAVGAALGWQKFLAHGRQQIITEIGGRADTDGSDDASAALGARYQRAYGHHTVLLVDAYGGWQENHDEFVGGRLELLFKF